MTPTDFVKTYYPFALQTEKKTGISGRFILAQAALESGWGKSIPGNMFFGVKANPKTTPENKKRLLGEKVQSCLTLVAVNCRKRRKFYHDVG